MPMIKNTDEFPNTVFCLPFISMPTKVKGYQKTVMLCFIKKIWKTLILEVQTLLH